MSDSTIRWESDAEGVVVLTLDDPSSSANTMNDAYVRSMAEVVDRLEAELVRLADARHHVGDGDEALGRNHVGEHGGTADARTLDDRDLPAQVRAHQRRLVAGGSAADDDDVTHASP